MQNKTIIAWVRSQLKEMLANPSITEGNLHKFRLMYSSKDLDADIDAVVDSLPAEMLDHTFSQVECTLHAHWREAGEYLVGDTFELNGSTYIVNLSRPDLDFDCSLCVFNSDVPRLCPKYSDSARDGFLCCNRPNRADNLNVYFTKVS